MLSLDEELEDLKKFFEYLGGLLCTKHSCRLVLPEHEATGTSRPILRPEPALLMQVLVAAPMVMMLLTLVLVIIEAVAPLCSQSALVLDQLSGGCRRESSPS